MNWKIRRKIEEKEENVKINKWKLFDCNQIAGIVGPVLLWNFYWLLCIEPNRPNAPMVSMPKHKRKNRCDSIVRQASILSMLTLIIYSLLFRRFDRGLMTWGKSNYIQVSFFVLNLFYHLPSHMKHPPNSVKAKAILFRIVNSRLKTVLPFSLHLPVMWLMAYWMCYLRYKYRVLAHRTSVKKFSFHLMSIISEWMNTHRIYFPVALPTSYLCARLFVYFYVWICFDRKFATLYQSYQYEWCRWSITRVKSWKYLLHGNFVVACACVFALASM